MDTSDLLFGSTFGLGVGLSLGLCFGFGGSKSKRVRNWRAINVWSILVPGLVFGLAYIVAIFFVLLGVIHVADEVMGGHADGLYRASPSNHAILFALGLGLASGIPLGPNGGHRLAEFLGKGRGGGLLAGAVVTIVALRVLGQRREGWEPWTIVSAVFYGLPIALGTWVVLVLVALAARRASRLADGFVGGLAVEFVDGKSDYQGPRESWRDDRVFGLVVGPILGLAFGLVVGCALGFGRGHFGVGLKFGLVFALVVGLVYGITSSETWPTTLAWRLQLWLSHHVPTVGLLSFLEDARRRGVLRTVGSVYQFRHAVLQDQLAEHATASWPSVTAQRPS